jgi:hypothetical protein
VPIRRKSLRLRRGGHGIKGFFHPRDETVTAFWDGFHEARILGRVPESLSQLHHTIIEAVIEVDKGVARPQAVAQFVAGNYLTWLFEEHGQNLEGLFGKPDAKAILTKFARP